MPHEGGFHMNSQWQTVAEVNLTAFHKNVKAIRKKIKEDSKLLAVIKTNAYGHGIVPIAKEAVKAGADRLGVTTIEEGTLLRKNGIMLPIHLLSGIHPEQAEEVVRNHLIASINSSDVAQAINQVAYQLNKTMPVHLKLDTGLHRFGMSVQQALQFFRDHNDLKNLYWEGIYTHFSHSDEGDWVTTEKQFRLYKETVKQLEEEDYRFQMKHVGASTIAIERKDMHLDMVRPGIALFGYQPSPRQKDRIELKPVLSLKTRIIQLHDLPEETKIGYGGMYTTKGNEKIAILPIGHGDGYKRRLSNNGYVLVKGKFAKIIGTIALDQTFVNVTNIPNVEVGDEVILIGSQGENQITARDIANWIDSNVDEVLASLMERVKRIYK